MTSLHSHLERALANRSENMSSAAAERSRARELARAQRTTAAAAAAVATMPGTSSAPSPVKGSTS